MIEPSPSATLDDVLITRELAGRPAREPDHERESRIMALLATRLAEAPDEVLQALVDAVIELGIAGSAGVSLRGDGPGGGMIWPVTAGRWSAMSGARLEAELLPCGVALLRREPLLFSRPQRHFPIARSLDPLICELLVVPFDIAGSSFGTIWAVTHEEGRPFNREDLRVLNRLADMASTATQLVAAREQSERRLRDVFGALETGFCVLERVRSNGTGDFIVLQANLAFAEMAAKDVAAGDRIGDLWPDLMPVLSEVATARAPRRIEQFSAQRERWFGIHAFPIGSPDRNELGLLVDDVTARHLGEQALRRRGEELHESEQRLRTLVEGIPQLVWRAVDAGRWTWASSQWTAFTGQNETDSREWGWLDSVHPDDHAIARDAWVQALQTGELDVDYRIRQGNKGYRWFHTLGRPVTNDRGEVVEWLGTSTDIDDLKRLREHERLLLAELQHRVRNTLAVIRSIARRTADNSDTVEDFRTHLDGRLAAFARTQSHVTRDPIRGIDLEAIVADELLAHQVHEGGAVTIRGPEVRLQPRMADTLGLALHELVTNAVKYGSLGGRQDGGGVAVSWRVDQAREGGQTLRLEWVETVPGGTIRPPTRTGFGAELLERTLAYDLDAEVKLDFRPHGLRCTIAVPLPPG